MTLVGQESACATSSSLTFLLCRSFRGGSGLLEFRVCPVCLSCSLMNIEFATYLASTFFTRSLRFPFVSCYDWRLPSGLPSVHTVYTRANLSVDLFVFVVSALCASFFFACDSARLVVACYKGKGRVFLAFGRLYCCYFLLNCFVFACIFYCAPHLCQDAKRKLEDGGKTGAVWGGGGGGGGTLKGVEEDGSTANNSSQGAPEDANKRVEKGFGSSL